MSQADQPNYRVYCHDGARKLVTAEWVEAASDEEAISAVRARYPGLHCELWDGERLVATIGPDRPAA